MRYKNFIRHYFAAFLLLVSVVFGFVTWVDPFRNLGFPWAIPFVSDRNAAYKKYKLLETDRGITDLVVGSSTSVVFVPQVLRERYGVQAFSGTTGAASLPARYILIQHALRTQPKIKRIIYVADLFEFWNADLDTGTYYQSEMMKNFDAAPLSEVRPGWGDRGYDFFSYLVIDRAFRTLREYSAYQRGEYVSAYADDGSITQSMIGGRPGGTIEGRVMSSALSMDSVYGRMTELHPVSRKIFRKLVELVQSYPGVELHLVVSPFHELFFNHFKNHFEETGIYSAWLRELQDLRSIDPQRIWLHDFSYPVYLGKGINQTELYWQDGVHVTSAAMIEMAREIYPARK